MGEYAELCQFSAELGILFLSTPFDPEAATMLNDLGMVAFKIASADLTNVPLLQTVAGFGKPVLLSTGAATFEEVRWAFDLMTGADLPVALLHCTLSYPTHLRDANLQRITALRDAFPHTIIGYSDHTQPQDSELACPLAVALGARIIEKHYTLDKSLSEDDHYHAVDTAGLTRLVTNCRDAEQLTSNYREITASEQPARQFARRSIVAARALKQGTRLTELDLDCKRPGTGLAPIQMPQLLGKILNRDLAEDELLALEFVE
jgi:N-acetylneuraminate synthase